MATSLSREALEEAFEYLDDLRESGRANMWGASGYLSEELQWNSEEANEATGLWMSSFGQGKTFDERVEESLA